MQTPLTNIQLILFMPLASAQVDRKVAGEERLFLSCRHPYHFAIPVTLITSIISVTYFLSCALHPTFYTMILCPFNTLTRPSWHHLPGTVKQAMICWELQQNILFQKRINFSVYVLGLSPKVNWMPSELDLWERMDKFCIYHLDVFAPGNGPGFPRF